jgi:hypothetical protein
MKIYKNNNLIAYYDRIEQRNTRRSYFDLDEYD